MSEELLEQVRRGGETAFAELADRYGAELQLHCYRITGSVQDAEDLVQETLLAAWRGLDGYEGRATVRTWLYRIATNRCLNALRDRARRPREVPMPPEETPSPPPPTRIGEPVWLEPYPDVLLEGLPDRAAQPEARYEAREAIGLAFVTAVQLLPPRQRAVLVLRDVLAFRAREVAEMLGVTEVAVNRALQRARQAVERAVPPGQRGGSGGGAGAPAGGGGGGPAGVGGPARRFPARPPNVSSSPGSPPRSRRATYRASSRCSPGTPC